MAHTDHYGYEDGTNLWLSGSEIHFIINNRHYSLQGVVQSATTEPPGRLYLDGSELGYVDNEGSYRIITFEDTTELGLPSQI